MIRSEAQRSPENRDKIIKRIEIFSFYLISTHLISKLNLLSTEYNSLLRLGLRKPKPLKIGITRVVGLAFTGGKQTNFCTYPSTLFRCE